MNNRTYFRELFIAIAAYVFALFASISLVNSNNDAWWRYIAALIPMIPAVFVLRAVIRQLARMDELQRNIQLEALAFAFGATAILTFSYGFLERVGLPELSMFFVWPVMAILWTIGLAVANRKYQ
jgi:O-antigen/teichoic acid export membrane protein